MVKTAFDETLFVNKKNLVRVSLIPGILSLLKTTLLSEMKIIVLSFLAHSIICVSFAEKKVFDERSNCGCATLFNVKIGLER